jgi:hypothetical protein
MESFPKQQETHPLEYYKIPGFAERYQDRKKY